MEPLEIFKVETPIESESESYRDIVRTIISDLVIAQIIGRLHIIIKPEVTLFQMALILREGLPVIKTIDFSTVLKGVDDNEIIINMSDEKYGPDLLMKLWIEYGRKNINQIERNRIIVNLNREKQVSEEIKKIENFKIADPNKTLKKKIIEMALRVTPEGFRVRYHSFKEKGFIYIATEEVMKNEWIKETEEMLYNLIKYKKE